MTLASMRRNGVHAIVATCKSCGRKAEVNVDAFPETIAFSAVGRRFRCSQCGGKRINTRPAWNKAREHPKLALPLWRTPPNWLLLLPAFMLGAALGHVSSSAQPSSPLEAAAEIHYAPGEDLETVDIALIGEATTQIDMAAYVLTDGAVIEALRLAAARGARVRIWRDAGMAAKVGDYDVEAQLGGRVRGLEIRSSSPGGELMHLKGYCVDHRLLRTGSANFSRSGETRQDNDLVALRGASVCAGFEAKFDHAWGS